MRIRGVYRFRQWWKWFCGRTRSRVLVLLYHRVAEPASDPFLLCVSPQRFAEHMQALHAGFKVLSTADLFQALEQQRIPHRAVVVTFDDGYVDNLCEAVPILQRFQIPATIFVTTGALDVGMTFWWDELDRLVLQAPALPRTLVVEIGGRIHQWELGQAAEFSPQTFACYRDWNVLSSHDPTPRHRAFRELHRLIRPLDAGSRAVVVEQLRQQARANPIMPGSARGMTVPEVRELAREPLVEVGAHTVTHPQLAALPPETQRREIAQSKHDLERLLDRSVRTFAYPYGDPSSVSKHTVAAARQAGFELAFANVPRPVTRRVDRFSIPRYVVGNWSGDEFARQVEHWFCE